MQYKHYSYVMSLAKLSNSHSTVVKTGCKLSSSSSSFILC